MKAETFLQSLFNRYPTIYGNRIQLLDHVFSVIGNGFHWENGKIVASDQEMLKELAAYLPEGDVTRAEQVTNINKSVYHFSGNDYTLYPLSDSSLIFKIPNDVREDWLAVAVEWIQYLSKNRTHTEYDSLNDFTRNSYTKSSRLLDELVSRYFDEHKKN